MAAVAVFGITLMTVVRRAYARIWDLSPAFWRGVWRQATDLVGLTGYVVVAAWSGVPWPNTAASPHCGSTVGDVIKIHLR